MQIACGRCDATYAVDDRLITERGVRAQCPGCRHMQRVSRKGIEAVRQPVPPPPAITPAQLPALPRRAAQVRTTDIPVRPGSASAHPAPTPATADPALCRACSGLLEDLFDRALGICGPCGLEEAANDASHPAAAGASGSMEFLPTEPMVRAVAAPAPRETQPAARTDATSTSVASVRAPLPGYAKWLMVGALIAVVFGVVAVGIALRTRAAAAEAHARARRTPPELEAVLPKWRMAHPALSGSAADKLEQGWRLISQDHAAAAAEASDLFQQAALLDPTSDLAVAGYVRALAVWRGSRVSTATYEEALTLIRMSERRSGRAPEVLIASAQLLLCRPDHPGALEGARTLAEEAAEKAQNARTKAEALYVLGRTWQPVSSELALKQFDDALTLNPELRPAWLERALAYDRLGDHARALRDLQRRLEIDPDHWPSNRELARIHQESGRPREARAIFERLLAKDEGDHRARLALAVVAYQAEGRLSDALATLRTMAARLDTIGEPEQLEVLTHLSAAERLTGQLGRAEAAANRAIAIVPTDAAAHLQLFLVALERNAPTDANRHLEALGPGLGDPALARVLEGRLRLLESRWEDAITAFDEASRLDERRVDAGVLAGIAAAGAKRRELAVPHLTRVLRWDPSRPLPEGPGSRRWVDPVWLLRGYEGELQGLPATAGDVLPTLYEGVYRYLMGDVGAGSRLFAQVLEKDARNVPALSWRTFALLKLGETSRAAASGERAEAVGRGQALAHYAHGAAQSALGNEREARRALTEAIRLDPGLLGAEERLAQLDVLQGDAVSGRVRLARIVSREPAWYSAKRLLYALEKENAGEGAGPR